MVYLNAAYVLVILVGIVYLYLLFESIIFSTSERNRENTETIEENWLEEKSFSLKAVISIVGSTVVLILLGTSPVFWDLTPFVTIGSAIAVTVAFLLDRKSRKIIDK